MTENTNTIQEILSISYNQDQGALYNFQAISQVF